MSNELLDKIKLKNDFHNLLLGEVNLLKASVCSENGAWKIKGFVDADSNIYTISSDTKVLSKIMELILFPKIAAFAKKNGYTIEQTSKQNFYPDMTFIDAKGNKFAVDIKSTYKKKKGIVNGMTLGAFTGYFRDRTKAKNIMYPYDSYKGHYVLGLIYERSKIKIDEQISHKISDLEKIPSVAVNLEFFIQEKYKIAIDRPGSGNTKNIGAVSKIDDLINGKGPFADIGEEIFDDYWMNYLTDDMLKKANKTECPYKNLTEYHSHKNSKK